MTNAIRLNISREAALASNSRVFGDSVYEPDEEELASLSVDELALLAIFQGDANKGPRLKLLRFPNPPWPAVVERIRSAMQPNSQVQPFSKVARAAMTTLGVEEKQAQREAGALEISEWLKGARPPLNLTSVPTEEAVRLAAGFGDLGQAALMNYPVADAFVRRLGELVAGSCPGSDPVCSASDLFEAEFATETRSAPRPAALALHARIVLLCARLSSWLPVSTHLTVNEVLRVRSRAGKDVFTGVVVEVSHPGAATRMTVAFSAETETA